MSEHERRAAIENEAQARRDDEAAAAQADESSHCYGGGAASSGGGCHAGEPIDVAFCECDCAICTVES